MHRRPWRMASPNARPQATCSPRIGAIRPIAVALSTTRPACANALQGRVLARTFLGDFIEYAVHTGDFRWRVHAIASERVACETNVWISFPPEAATIMPEA